MAPTDFITIQGKQIAFTRSVVSITDCELDPKNPRIQYMLGQRPDNLTLTDIDDLLWEKDAVKALAQSIRQNGAVYEPIIVQRRDDKYRVREGNCRTVACRHLNEPGIVNIPAMIFDDELSEEDLAVLLADMHVASKIRWDAYEQAKHVADLHHVYGKTYDWLGNHLRLSKTKINELLLAYQATTEFLKIHPAQINLRKFSFFQELMKKKELRLKYSDDPQFKEKFQKWLHEGKITAALQVRSLSTILSNSEAESALDTFGFEEAEKVLIRNDPSLESSLFWAVKNACEKISTAPANEIQDLKSGNTQKLIMLRNLHRAIDDMATLAGVRL